MDEFVAVSHEEFYRVQSEQARIDGRRNGVQIGVVIGVVGGILITLIAQRVLRS